MSTHNDFSPPSVPVPLSLAVTAAAALIKANSLVGGFGAIALGLLAWIYAPGTTVPVWVLVVTFFVLFATIIVLLNIVLDLYERYNVLRSFLDEERARFLEEREKRYEERSPACVTHVVSPFHPFNLARCILIVEWPVQAAPPIGSQVVISSGTDTHELPLGTGALRKRQEDGRVVVTLDTVFPDVEAHIQELKGANSAERVKRLRIGTTFDYSASAGVVSGGAGGVSSNTGMSS